MSQSLLARVRAVLRRAQRPGPPAVDAGVIRVGDITVNVPAHVATIAGHVVDLAPREFDLLHALALEAGRVLSVDELLARVWGAEYEGEPQVVYVHIRWLREKIEEDPQRPRRIVTVRGVGYRLEPREA
jgi:DNA-binding response OmpR family regulator